MSFAKAAPGDRYALPPTGGRPELEKREDNPMCHPVSSTDRDRTYRFLSFGTVLM